MKRDARAEGLRWLEQAEADRNGLPDSIPARVYTRPVAEEVLRLADQVLHLVEGKLRGAGFRGPDKGG